jgi:hypothetical protein
MSTLVYLMTMMALGTILAGGIYLALKGSRGAHGRALDPGRRSFLRGGGAESERACFIGMQMAIQVFGSDELRARLASLILSETQETPETTADAIAGETRADQSGSVVEKKLFLKSLSSLLMENQYAWEYGFWDYRGAGDEAISHFNQWKNEIEASMATTPEEMGETIDPLHRYSDQKEFLIVTLLLLIDSRDEAVSDDPGDYEFRPTYAQLAAPLRAQIEGISREDYWRSATFQKLLDGISALDSRTIERDGVYIFPGAAGDGISTLDLLSDEGWKYLTDHSLRHV